MTIGIQSKPLLKRVKGYSAVVRRWPFPNSQRKALPFHTSLWIERLMNRYRYHEQRWPFMSYEFTHSKGEGTTVVTQNTANFSQVLINPRLLLRLLINQNHSTQNIQPVLRENWQLSARREYLATMSGYSPLNQEEKIKKSAIIHYEERLEKTDLITRILQQGKRIETFSAAPTTVIRSKANRGNISTNSLRDEMDDPAVIAKVYRKSTSKSENLTDESNMSSQPAKAESQDNMGAMTKLSNQPEVDIGRITDQVMQVLDQRIIAQRERLGRV
jgi:hypothetical protein